MTQQGWNEFPLPQLREDLLYEVFHENSKLGRHAESLSQSEVAEHLKRLSPTLKYEGYPRVNLPGDLNLHQVSLFQTIRARASVRSFIPSQISLRDLATLLYCCYGVTRTTTVLPRGLRTIPSAGALYPLEIYLNASCLENHDQGLYHYDPEGNCLRLLQVGDTARTISQSIVQPQLLNHAVACIFITAIFERTVFKYQDRGYRFALMEAGHVAQNVNLAACGLGMGSVNIGGFFDREIDDLLHLDGVTHSTLYMIAIGRPEQVPAEERSSRR